MKQASPPKVKHIKVPNTVPTLVKAKPGTNGKMTQGAVNLSVPDNGY